MIIYIVSYHHAVKSLDEMKTITTEGRGFPKPQLRAYLRKGTVA